jgi:hypothetical protein
MLTLPVPFLLQVEIYSSPLFSWKQAYSADIIATFRIYNESQFIYPIFYVKE